MSRKARRVTEKNMGPRFVPVNDGYVIPIVAPHFKVSRTCVTYPLLRVRIN